MAFPAIGSSAPNFKLTNKDKKTLTLASFKKDFLVLYFYPKDNTPGCTIEAKDFSSNIKALNAFNADVVGISGGDDKTKAKFCKDHSISIELLSDTDFKISKAYKSYGDKSFMGKKFKGIFRSTFIFDKKRKLVKHFEKVDAAGHVDEVLNFFKELKGAGKTKAKTATPVVAKKAKKITARRKAPAKPAVKSRVVAKSKKSKATSKKRANS